MNNVFIENEREIYIFPRRRVEVFKREKLTFLNIFTNSKTGANREYGHKYYTMTADLKTIVKDYIIGREKFIEFIDLKSRKKIYVMISGFKALSYPREDQLTILWIKNIKQLGEK